MSKRLWVLLAGVIIGILGFFALNKYIYNEKQGNSMDDNTDVSANTEGVKVTPISHATMVLQLGGQVLYTDPVGGPDQFADQPEANIILITDIHGDHLEPDTVQALSTERTILVVPQAVADQLSDTIPGKLVVLKNGETTEQNGITIEAIPMYNVPESPDAFHTKGRGNGYVLEAAGKRIYIAGDTGNIPEMRALQNIDMAFVPMNLPYTMSVEDAAKAVLAFKPKVVHPYHYRGPDGLADINKFKELVNAGDPNISVEILNFYPEENN